MPKPKASIYRMSRDGWGDFFLLHVSSDAEAMRRHTEEVAGAEGWPVPEEGWTGTRGLVHPMLSLDGPFAHLFLAEDGLDEGIVAHECLHAATSHERFVLRFGMAYGDQIGDDEERLAYFLTSCVRGVYATLREHGHWK